MIHSWPDELSAHTQSLELSMLTRVRVLTDALAHETGADLIALIEETGYIIVRSGARSSGWGEEVGVLAVAVSSATSALASVLGTGEPREILQNCGSHSFFLTAVTSKCQLLVVFGESHRTGMIRLAVEEAVPQLRMISGLPGLSLPPGQDNSGGGESGKAR